MSSLLTDGVYKIENIGRGLMLDLKGLQEGTTIEGHSDNGSVAQQWIITDQSQPGFTFSRQTVTIQSTVAGPTGMDSLLQKYRCYLQDSGERVLYTMKKCFVNVLGASDDGFSVYYENNNLVLAIPSRTQPEVKLENFTAGNARQMWRFIRVES
ncbi:hypothetical protein DEU56DRAFT_917447 [Suillus clintonianus]|uniref:uncharacterized protein n=1 Tax=Suillus clintonianus TaxID=1904413 RepID=UPI001B884B10|nr:uncharacterized protein DEU56DRAFT_917447 [Suillus clintonianus]KAG2123487.1 hypothetical protein DEU56DRAFT_917447 [Suillus clintonianus]